MSTSRNENPHQDEPAPEETGSNSGVREHIVSYLISVAVHGLMLLLMAFFVLGSPDDVALEDVLASEILPEEDPKVLPLEQVFVENVMVNTPDQDSSQIVNQTMQLANASPKPPVVDSQIFTDRGVLPTDTGDFGNGFGGTAETGAGDGSGNGDGAGNGTRKKGRGEVGFFGSTDKGKSFVFIVDCSGSMTTPTTTYQPRINGVITRFFRARQELFKSLGQLEEDQSFYVIFYNHETYPMFFPRNAQALVPAKKDFLLMSRNWIAKVDPGGGTDPRMAFQIALSLRPDVIFFLTDGAIPAATRGVAKNHNKSRTRIHTIAFGLQKNQQTLRGIAADNQGRYCFVP